MPAAQRDETVLTIPLVGGVLALDFANTFAGAGTSSPKEFFCEISDILAWAWRCGVLEDVDGSRSQKMAKHSPAPRGRFMRDTKVLRDALRGVCLARAHGTTPSENDLEVLRRLHARCLETATLTSSEDGLTWGWADQRDLIDAVLGPVCVSAISLLTVMDQRRIKTCGNPGCGWLFYDMTKSRTRRWCEMAACGNRAKQKALRLRSHRLGKKDVE
jgi:predicted RNA-binding Zn ribbon-like protein